MSEEAILRKFVADGDGWGEDRRLQTLFTIIRNLDPNNAGADDDQKVENLLRLCNYSIHKHVVMGDLLARETVNVKEFVTEINAEIETLKEKIDGVKLELEKARLTKANKEEYDRLAREILERPSREETTENLERLNTSLADLHDTQKELEVKLAEKRKQVHALNALLDEFSEAKPIPESQDDGEGTERSTSPQLQGVSEDEDSEIEQKTLEVNHAID